MIFFQSVLVTVLLMGMLVIVVELVREGSYNNDRLFWASLLTLILACIGFMVF